MENLEEDIGKRFRDDGEKSANEKCSTFCYRRFWYAYDHFENDIQKDTLKKCRVRLDIRKTRMSGNESVQAWARFV